MTPELIAERLAHFGPLRVGAHQPNGEACIMEAVAFVAGEQWSDHPECACPTISALLRTWNDALPDEERDALLRPLVPKLVGTRSTKTVEKLRRAMAVDWLIRVHTSAWLRLAGLTDHAAALAALPEITDFAQLPTLHDQIIAAGAAAAAAARAAARAAGWNATGDAAYAAAVNAARAAAGTAAMAAGWDAAGTAAYAAAVNAARAAGWDAAYDAAARAAGWNATGAAARAALSATRIELQQSALALVRRMIAVETAP